MPTDQTNPIKSVKPVNSVVPEKSDKEVPTNSAAKDDQKEPEPHEENSAEVSENNTNSEATLFKSFDQKTKSNHLKPLLIILLIIGAGVASGFGLSRIQGGTTSPRSTQELSEKGVQPGDVFGLPDESTFRDQAQGIVVKGGIDGEGSHHLVRAGGDSQSVYLTSSTVDLDVFVDHKVRVWGETFAARTAGWLMDVGRVEVIELNAEKPTEE